MTFNRYVLRSMAEPTKYMPRNGWQLTDDIEKARMFNQRNHAVCCLNGKYLKKCPYTIVELAVTIEEV